MRRSAFVLTLLASVAPSSAWALDRTAGLDNDARLRVVEYDAEQVVMLYCKVGQACRIRLDPNERVVKGGVTKSDQFGMSSEAEADDVTPCDDNDSREECTKTALNADAPQSCDRNMCVSTVLNTVYILPRRELQPQPFFLRTEWCPEPGRCLPGEYAIELTTLPPRVHVADAGRQVPAIKEAFYGVQYRYASRQQTYRAQIDQEKRREAAKARQEFRRNNPAPLPPSVPDAAARWELGVCGSGQQIHPDEAWTDGRTTFLRYKGTRRLPNVYEKRADGERTLIASVPEPDAWGNTIRIAKVLPILLLWDGDIASCVLNVAPDISGLGEMAVAPIRNPVAGRPRPRSQ